MKAMVAQNILGFASLLAWYLNLRRAKQHVQLDTKLFLVQAALSLAMLVLVVTKSLGAFDAFLIGDNVAMTILWALVAFLMFLTTDTFLDRYFQYLSNVGFLKGERTTPIATRANIKLLFSNRTTNILRLVFRIICVSMSVTVLFALVPGVDDMIVFKVHLAQAMFVVVFISNAVTPNLLAHVRQDFRSILEAYDPQSFMGLRIQKRITYLSMFQNWIRVLGMMNFTSVVLLRIYFGSFQKLAPYYIISCATLPPTGSMIVAYCFWPMPISKMRRICSSSGPGTGQSVTKVHSDHHSVTVNSTK